jgi:hypothetical protein
MNTNQELTGIPQAIRTRVLSTPAILMICPQNSPFVQEGLAALARLGLFSKVIIFVHVPNSYRIRDPA